MGTKPLLPSRSRLTDQLAFYLFILVYTTNKQIQWITPVLNYKKENYGQRFFMGQYIGFPFHYGSHVWLRLV
jgi:hypothetical protein